MARHRRADDRRSFYYLCTRVEIFKDQNESAGIPGCRNSRILDLVRPRSRRSILIPKSEDSRLRENLSLGKVETSRNQGNDPRIRGTRRRRCFEDSEAPGTRSVREPMDSRIRRPTDDESLSLKSVVCIRSLMMSSFSKYLRCPIRHAESNRDMQSTTE